MMGTAGEVRTNLLVTISYALDTCKGLPTHKDLHKLALYEHSMQSRGSVRSYLQKGLMVEESQRTPCYQLDFDDMHIYVYIYIYIYIHTYLHLYKQIYIDK